VQAGGLKKRVLVRLFSTAVFLGGLTGAALLCLRLANGEREEIRRNTQARATGIAAHLQAGIINSIEPLGRLGTWWLSQGKPLARDDWQTDGELFLRRAQGLRNASWVGTDGFEYWSAGPGTVPKAGRVKPPALVTQLIGVAEAHWTTALSDVYGTPEATNVFYAASPVIRNGRIRGYVIGEYDLATLLSSVAHTRELGDSTIFISSRGRQIYAQPPDSPSPATDDPRATIQLFNREWILAVRQPLNYFQEFRTLIAAAAGLMSAVAYLLFLWLWLSQRRSAELGRANQALEAEIENRKRIESEVRELNRLLNRRVAEFETLLDVNPVGIAIAEDPECRVIRANRALAGMLGVPEGANISKSGLDATSQSHRILRNGRELTPEELPMQVAARTGKHVIAEQDEIVRADGKVLHILSFASPLFDENGNVRGVVNACVDISDRQAQEQLRRELEQRLQRAERMKSLGVMAAGIAHDFNNLLTSMIGQSSLALECLPESAEAQHHLAASLDAAQRAASLIQQVLAFTGQAFHRVRPTDLGELIHDISPLLCRLTADGTDLHYHVEPALPKVVADPDEIRQILHNLVLNAVEAMGGAGGSIDLTIETRQLSGNEHELAPLDIRLDPGLYVCVRVCDGGAGMPREIAEKAFDPFFSTKFLGRGLGLSEVLGIMRAHGGAVRLETAPDSGTTVELFFPAAKPAGVVGREGAESQAA
jgi:PAS domain S-box-containing protein